MEYDFDNEELDNTPVENEQDEPSRDSRQFVRKLEQDAKAGKAAMRERDAAKAEVEAAKRELALMKAGIDLESPTGKLFAKSYDGENTVEAIKASAGEYGLIPTSQTAEVKNDLDALDRVANASTSNTGSVAPNIIDKIKNATPDEVMKLLAEAGVAISNEEPGKWIPLV